MEYYSILKLEFITFQMNYLHLFTIYNEQDPGFQPLKKGTKKGKGNYQMCKKQMHVDVYREDGRSPGAYMDGRDR